MHVHVLSHLSEVVYRLKAARLLLRTCSETYCAAKHSSMAA